MFTLLITCMEEVWLKRVKFFRRMLLLGTGAVGPRHLIKANLMHEHAANEGPVVSGQIYHLQCFPYSIYFDRFLQRATN